MALSRELKGLFARILAGSTLGADEQSRFLKLLHQAWRDKPQMPTADQNELSELLDDVLHKRGDSLSLSGDENPTQERLDDLRQIAGLPRRDKQPMALSADVPSDDPSLARLEHLRSLAGLEEPANV